MVKLTDPPFLERPVIAVREHEKGDLRQRFDFGEFLELSLDVVVNGLALFGCLVFVWLHKAADKHFHSPLDALLEPD